MAVLTRSALEDSPLADLHLIASELGIDGYRRLRKADLVDRILEVQGGEPAAAEAEAPTGEEEPAGEAEAAPVAEPAADEEPEGGRRRRRRGGRRRRGERADDEERDGGEEGRREPDEREDRQVEGVVELLANGSGFLRVSPPDASEDDVYISAAQVRRCELVSGDRVAGPVRPPRRSERYPSLVRIDTINGRSADEVAEGTPFDELSAGFPTERFGLGADDPTLKAIEWLTPLGRGSRATIVGPARAGKTEALRRLAAALSREDGLDVTVVLTGVRPEEQQAWRDAGLEPAAALTFAASADAQSQAVERGVETAKRIAARGGHAVVCIDTLDLVHEHTARKAMAAARNIVDGGSLTIVATSTLPLGGETTVISLDLALTSTGRFPALDLVSSGTLRPELLVGDAGAEAIAQARAAALG